MGRKPSGPEGPECDYSNTGRMMKLQGRLPKPSPFLKDHPAPH